MYKFLKRYIIKKITRFIGVNLDAIINHNNDAKIKSTKLKLKNAGENVQIEYPFFIEGHKFISIGDNFRCKYNLRLEALNEYGNQIFNPSVTIGNNVTVESNLHVGCINSIIIGNGVLIASNVFISDHSHGDYSPEQLQLEPLERQLFSKGEVKIGNNVWIGENVTILSGVCIGDNVIIGAKSLVINSFESNCIIAGTPAKIIKRL